MSHRCLTLIVALLIAPAMTDSASAQPSSDVPVRKVLLFSSGVGYFEHTGQVEGTAQTELRFTADQINDVLKSLVLQDLSGGRVRSVVYPSKDPIEKILGSFEVDLTANPSLGELLNQLRGSRVRLQTGGRTLQGTILGAERQGRLQGGAAVETWVLNVLDGGGIRAVALPEVEAVELEDPALQNEFTQALAALAQARDQNKKPVTIQFDGRGSRNVRIGYVVEVPLWKTSYRLLLPEAGEEGHLQGWALVENQTDTDWDGVELTLVSGRPISFIQDLYEPLYVERPRVEPETYATLRPQVYEEGMPMEMDEDAALRAMAPPPAPGRMRAQMMNEAEAARDAAFDPTASILADVEAAAVGELFEYRIGSVTLPRQRSAMIPIVTQPVTVERLSIFNASVQPNHPLNGVRLENSTGLFLAQGPITVFDGGTYAGDARLPDLPEGQDRLLSYALDLGIRVDYTVDTENELIQNGTLIGGVLRIVRTRASRHTYTIKSNHERPKTVVIEHPRRSGWTPSDSTILKETTDALYRYELEIGAGETLAFPVEEMYRLSETIQVIDAPPERLAVFAGARSISPELRRVLEEVVTRKRQIDALDVQARTLRARLDEIAGEQERLRENMGEVDRTSDYYRRLLAKLESQEDEIEETQDEIASLQQQRQSRLRELRTYLEGISIDS